MSRKTSFMEFWRSKKERGELVERANRRRLLPSQLKRLLGDGGVRAGLQNSSLVSLLPPVGTEVFKRLTRASLGEVQRHHEAGEEEQGKNKEVEEDRHKPANVLEAGEPLPFIYGDPPPQLLSIPLEELDPYYQSQKTFVVLGRGNVIQRFNAEPACYLLSPFSPLRTGAIWILMHSFFKCLIMLTVLTNCVFMTLSEPSAEKTMEHVFTAVYTLEAILKVASRGFCVGKFTFLRDVWNWLDVLVVVTAYLALAVDLGRCSVLTTVPRVLKLLPLISGLRSTVGVVGRSVRSLAGVSVLALFWLSVWAVIGTQLFMGGLRQNCIVWPVSMETFSEESGSGWNYTTHTSDPLNIYFFPNQLDPLLCGNHSAAGVCPEGFICLRAGQNPNYGYTSYDSFGWSLLSVFRLMTRDFWDNLARLTIRAEGRPPMAFFMLLVLPGSFCLYGLILAVVTMATCEQEEAAAAAASQREEEFKLIVEALKRREEDEVTEGEDDKNQNPHDEGSGKRTSCPPRCSFLAELLLRWSCCGCWRSLKQFLRTFVLSPFFDLGILVCLLANIVFMALEHFPMTVEFEQHLSVAYLVFTAIFTAEMVVKVVALDPYDYFQVSWNIFDSIIVILSLLELTLAGHSGVALLRIFRLARWWPVFHMLLRIMWTSLRALRNAALLLLMAVFMFSVVGRQLFQEDYKDHVCRISIDCQLPRWHMNNFFSTFLIIARILHGQWIETMWDCMEVSGQAMCLIFFMLFLVIGNLLVLNLFLTLLLSSVISDSLLVPEESRKTTVHIAVTRIFEHIRTFLGRKDHTVGDPKGDQKKEYLALNLSRQDQNIKSKMVPIAASEIKSETPENEEEEKFADMQKAQEVHQVTDDEDGGDRPEACCSDHTSRSGGRVWSNLRRACLLIVQHKSFEVFIIFIILLSTIAMMFEDVYLQTRPVLKTVLETADLVFTCVFLLEMFLKWTSFGLRRYFSSGWCWLDFLVLDVFVVSLMAGMLGVSELGAMRSLRTLRALGPLRALSRFQCLKTVVEVLVRTVPSLANTLLASQMVLLVFSLVGVNLFAGRFSYCFNETAETFFLPEQVDNHSQCLFLLEENFTEVRWKNAKFNFDHVSMGYLSLLLVAASGDWADVTYSAVDAREIQSQPSFEHNPCVYLFFIFFVIGVFFSLNLFIRVIINNLQREEIRKHVFMTKQQEKYYSAMKKRFSTNHQTSASPPQNQFQARFYHLVTNPYFDVFMVAVISLNVVSLTVESNDQSETTDHILHWIYFAILIIFIMEFILKIIALRKNYFTDWLNILDFIVILGLTTGLFIYDYVVIYFFPTAIFSLLRLSRIVRVLHLFRCTRGIRKLLLAFVMSLPALINIGLVLVLITVTFSILGMFNFAHLKQDFGLDDMTNFQTFWNSLSCLFMTTTSSSWVGLLLPALNTPPECDPLQEIPGLMDPGNCGNPMVGVVFFTSYILLYFLLMVHLYIAVVLETSNPEGMERLSDHDREGFYRTWRRFDPEATQFIPYSELSDFCDDLQDPLRIPKPNTFKLIHMDLPLFAGDQIHCLDLFHKLTAQVLDDPGEMESHRAQMKEEFMENLSKVSSEPVSSTLKRKREEVAAALIQRAYRKGLLKRAEEAPGSAPESPDPAVLLAHRRIVL